MGGMERMGQGYPLVLQHSYWLSIEVPMIPSNTHGVCCNHDVGTGRELCMVMVLQFPHHGPKGYPFSVPIWEIHTAIYGPRYEDISIPNRHPYGP